MPTYHMGWDEVEASIQALSKSVPPPTRGLIAIARGGIVPAGLLVRHWSNLHIFVIGLTRYNLGSFKGGKIRPTQFNFSSGGGVGSGEGWYIVDDLVDEGVTMERAKYYYPRAKSLTIAHKGKTTPPDYFAFAIAADIWIQFPWEDSGL